MAKDEGHQPFGVHLRDLSILVEALDIAKTLASAAQHTQLKAMLMQLYLFTTAHRCIASQQTA